MRLTYYMGDLYPNLGNYNDTTATTIPLPQDVAAIDKANFDGVIQNVQPDVSQVHMNSHYFGLIIIAASILLLGIRL